MRNRLSIADLKATNGSKYKLACQHRTVYWHPYWQQIMPSQESFTQEIIRVSFAQKILASHGKNCPFRGLLVCS
jgi:hypothetical protein